MAVLTSGRSEGCFDNQGGIRNLYLFKYVDYTYSQIVGGCSTLTSFPATTIYEFGTRDATFSEQITNDENGIKFDQTLTFTLKKQDVSTTHQLFELTEIDLRYIVRFNDGTYRIGGLFNGGRLTFVDVSGGSKQSLNGYNITINSSQECTAAYLANLDLFVIGQFILLEDGFNLLLETGDKLIIE